MRPCVLFDFKGKDCILAISIMIIWWLERAFHRRYVYEALQVGETAWS